jgi:hypothetical protein
MNYPHYVYITTRLDTEGNYARRVATIDHKVPGIAMAAKKNPRVQSVELHTHISSNEVEMETLFYRHRYNTQSVSQLSGESAS